MFITRAPFYTKTLNISIIKTAIRQFSCWNNERVNGEKDLPSVFVPGRRILYITGFELLFPFSGREKELRLIKPG
jgi:hypothetical protein